jgi:enoyl-CoA hydratase/carnithine racemase
MTRLVKLDLAVSGVRRLVLSSPHNYNALSEQLLTELLEQVLESRDDDTRVLVLDHDSKAFCSGVDLRERVSAGPSAPHSGLLSALLTELWTMPKPMVSCVHGIARGGGMALLACSDFVVAASTSSFAYSEVRVGVFPALVAAVTFPKLSPALVGPWMLSGEPFDAEEAQRLGLVTRVAPSAGLVSADPEIQALLRGGPQAVVETKRLLRAPSLNVVVASIELMRAASERVFGTAEAVEGMTAFQQRRSPDWSFESRSAG